MNFRNIEFLIQEAFIGIRRNGLMAFASISTIALSLGVLGAFVLVALGINNFASAQLKEFEIAVHVRRQAGEKGAREIASEVRGMKYVESVTMMDRNKEWLEFRRKHPDIESAGLPRNPLPYTMRVRVSEPARIGAIAARIRAMPNIDRVNEGNEILSRVMMIVRVLKIVSIIGVAALLVTAVFIISNAIKLTLYARRREIRVMQLVGATNSFIRAPLVIEGIVFGACGALLASLLLRVSSGYLCRLAGEITPMLAQFRCGVAPPQVTLALVLVGAAIGALGSFVSIRRFLHDEPA